MLFGESKKKSSKGVTQSVNNCGSGGRSVHSSLNHSQIYLFPNSDSFVRSNVEEFIEGERKIATSFSCSTIRIGTYKFDSKEKVVITSKGIKIVAPSLKDPNDLVVLNIQNSEIIKVIGHFSKNLHIIFLYTKPSCVRYINVQLQMTQNGKSE